MRHALGLSLGPRRCACALMLAHALACSSPDQSKPDPGSAGAAASNAASSGSPGEVSGGNANLSATGGASVSATGGSSSHAGAPTGGSAPTPEGSAGAGGNGSGAGSGGASGGADTGGTASTCDAELAASNKARANAALDALFVDKQTSAIAEYWADPYLQHNPIAKSGVAAFTSVMSGLVTSASFKYERLRTLAECELVVVQGRYSSSGVIFDMFRLKDGKLMEHWDSDANQASSADGPTEITHPEQAGASRSVVLTHLSGGSSDLLASGYVDHRALSAAKIEYTKVHHVIADGDFVFALSEGTLDGKPYGFYDLFRLAEGKLAEHWDSRRAVPASTASGLGIF